MNIDFEFACQDDCLDKMVPSDLRKLVAERDALAAQVEVVKQNLAQCYPHIKSADRKLYFSLGEALQLIEKSLESLPQQCLAEIRADAGRAGFIEAYKIRGEIMHAAHSGEYEALNRFANQYAESIRKGGE